MNFQQILEWYGFIGLIFGVVFISGCTILERNIKTFFSALLFSPLVVAFWPIVIYEWISGRRILLRFDLSKSNKRSKKSFRNKMTGKIIIITGLILSIIGTVFLSKGLILTDQRVNQLSGTYLGQNKFLKEDLTSNRNWAIIGFIFLGAGFALQILGTIKM